MKKIEKLLLLKQQLIEEISSIDSLKRGKISISTPTRKRADGTTYQAGPYYVFQIWKDGKNHSEYISAEDYPLLQSHVDNYQLLKDTCEKLAEVMEQISLLSDPALDRKKKSSNKVDSKNSKRSSVKPKA